MGGPRRSAIVVVSIVAVVAACGGPGPTPSTAPASPAPPSATAAVPATPQPTALPSPTARTTVTEADIVFAPAGIVPEGLLDIVYPSDPGPWPVAVMFHGGAGGRASLGTEASKVARLGFVVFVPWWGVTGGEDYAALAPHEQATADMAHAACAVAFAVEHAAEYGGDPARLVVYGFSAGATPAAIVSFDGVAPRADCAAKAAVEADVLITLEGDWLLAGLPQFHASIKADPLFFDALTPWSAIANRPDLPVYAMQTSGGGEGGPAASALGPDGWLATRDPDGAFLAALESFGAFDDGTLDVLDLQRLWADRLRTTGNLAEFITLEDSSHNVRSGRGMTKWLDTFTAAAAMTR